MIKKYFFTSLLASTLFVAGCANSNNATEQIDQGGIDGGNSGEANDPATLGPTDDTSSRLGYVRYDKDQLDMDAEQNHAVTIDRHKLADTITRLILRNEGFGDAATLVTDDEVLIAYDKPDDLDPDEAATIVKKTAMSITPRFYHVYVSDKAVTFRDIQSLKNSTSESDDHQNTLDSIIEDMKEAPQGEDVKMKSE
ncbi:YhcN/YlaJ family sporulation lipoprotein [Aquibacillus sp. 3ASR75-11]|uniref:YhcN/YlaJ family sporulation lipoprotein n=1 Tax=Terrihalobacillus insolitus TaxID=2950438 RepID=A0A9X3WMU3_9BACI|nr:YhcN/YlaJ family sporulation lipoprotein [Terrihalobacillus insolitus]MDC3412355.1 YhcN/YlaJ family sporulation lipoprotein [Terrihalobacillus insolitus]MDC3422952.1 YhcN/YlaJ family sporulation lipoprotein [Terrihalobacillus insolitus]